MIEKRVSGIHATTQSHGADVLFLDRLKKRLPAASLTIHLAHRLSYCLAVDI